jgi:hypothetical protein
MTKHIGLKISDGMKGFVKNTSSEGIGLTPQAYITLRPIVTNE